MRSGPRAALARGVAVVTAAAAIGGAAHADAVDQPPDCQLVRDRSGDDAVQQQPAVVHLSDSLDIVSGDVATTSKVLIAVIRVAQLGLQDPAAPTGQLYVFELTSGGRRFRLSAQRTHTGEEFTGSVYDRFTGASGAGSASLTPLGDVGGFFDDSRSEVHIRVALARLRQHAPFGPGDEVRQLRVDTYRNVGESGVAGYRTASTGSWSDSATSSRRHVVGTPTCVPGSQSGAPAGGARARTVETRG